MHIVWLVAWLRSQNVNDFLAENKYTYVVKKTFLMHPLMQFCTWTHSTSILAAPDCRCPFKKATFMLVWRGKKFFSSKNWCFSWHICIKHKLNFKAIEIVFTDKEKIENDSTRIQTWDL